MNDLEYLQAAAGAGWSLSDFYLDREDYAWDFVYDYMQPVFYDIIRMSDSFRSWGAKLDSAIVENENHILTDIEFQESECQDFLDNEDLDLTVLLIATNVLAKMAFKRLQNYVDMTESQEKYAEFLV